MFFDFSLISQFHIDDVVWGAGVLPGFFLVTAMVRNLHIVSYQWFYLRLGFFAFLDCLGPLDVLY
jgi:hypothetical protein